MFIATNQIKFKLLAVVVAIALIAPVVMIPAGAAQASEKCQWEGIVYLDIEIKVIDGQPVFVYETEEGYEKIPFLLSDLGDYAYYADGQKVPLKTQGNNILVQTEEGLVPVPIEEFDVVMVDEQIMLVAEENPLKFVPVAVAIAALKKAGVAVTTTTIKAATVLIAAGKRVTAASVRGVVRAFSLIRKANEVLAREIGKRPLTSWSVAQWLEGQCILPWCAARTPDGPTGDFFCRNCAKSIGTQIYGPKIF